MLVLGTRACDIRLARLVSYIHHTCEYRQYCDVGNTAHPCRLGLFRDSDFAGDLEDSNLLRPSDNTKFPMPPRSHFLSNRQRCAMSKRVQESTLKEESAVAKPRPMNLVSKNLLSVKKDPPQELSDPNSPGNQELDQSCVLVCSRKMLRDTNQSWKQARRNESSNSARARKLEREER